MSVLGQMLEKYDTTTVEGRVNGLREVMQEVALAGLYRGGFFDRAAFYGGTCLRIFYGLPRFSEDLDFSLLTSDADFSLEPYFKAVRAEFLSLGLDVEISSKKKTVRTGIDSAFLKSDTRLFTLAVHGKKRLKSSLRLIRCRHRNFQQKKNFCLNHSRFMSSVLVCLIFLQEKCTHCCSGTGKAE
jgi:Nucleotidyl transferase AbiEii toxin, Type IV TA system